MRGILHISAELLLLENVQLLRIEVSAIWISSILLDLFCYASAAATICYRRARPGIVVALVVMHLGLLVVHVGLDIVVDLLGHLVLSSIALMTKVEGGFVLGSTTIHTSVSARVDWL